ncbi:MAG: DUF1566 domain-containing protein [Treponema sp.]|nr:DUF1566 domain-containing protein [Treponema sp.]
MFYDKGVYSDGWRYLEAAPADFEGSFAWGPEELQITGLERGVGTGKRNTEIIMSWLEQYKNPPMTAAVLCWTYEINGYDDWFLPSIDELELLYQNLVRFGHGGFGVQPEVYWSSTSPGWLSNNTIISKTVRAILFENGGKGNISQTNKELVRAIRAF